MKPHVCLMEQAAFQDIKDASDMSPEGFDDSSSASRLGEPHKCTEGQAPREVQEEKCFCSVEYRMDWFGLPSLASEEEVGKRQTHGSQEASIPAPANTSVNDSSSSNPQEIASGCCTGGQLNGYDSDLDSETVAVESFHSSASTSSVIISVESLPVEILLKIFSFFHPIELCRSVSQVCKQWQTLAFDHSLWHKLDLSSPHLHVSGYDVCSIVHRVGGGIHELNLHGLDQLTTAEMAVIAECCPELTHLDLGFVSTVNRVMIDAILKSCPKLRYLNVEGCKDVHHDFVRGLVLQPCVSLSELNFSHCPLVDDSLLLLSSKLSKIVTLNIDGISWISNRTVEELAKRHKDSLEELILDGAELTDYAIQCLTSCTHLNLLSVSFCELLTDVSLQLIPSLPSLRQLCLRKGAMFSSRGLWEFLSASSLASLTSLDLSECTALSDEGVKALVKSCGPSLRTLNLSWCWDVTDNGLTAIVDGCNKLVKLHLVGLHRLTGSCLDLVPEQMPSLKFLDLQQCNLIQDPLVADVVRRKPDLVVINYYGETFIHGSSD